MRVARIDNVIIQIGHSQHICCGGVESPYIPCTWRECVRRIVAEQMSMGTKLGTKATSCVLLTTAARVDYFAPVLGVDVDVRLDPSQTSPLHKFLESVASAGGALVVLDEAHFYDPGDMLAGIECFLDNPDMSEGALEFIVICSTRSAGDWLLARIAGYCGIYDIIYDCAGAEATMRLAGLLRRRNTRFDVIDVLRSPHEAVM